MGAYALYYDASAPLPIGGPPKWYVVTVVGSGSSTNPYRALMPALPNTAAMIPTNAQGAPIRTWSLVAVDIDDEFRMLASGALRLPDPTGLPVSGPHKAAITLRTGVNLSAATSGLDVLNAVGSYLDPAFAWSEMEAIGQAEPLDNTPMGEAASGIPVEEGTP
jgi:hypothetical protein